MYCLTQLTQSLTHKKHADKTRDDTYSEYYDNLKSPFFSEYQNDNTGAGDSVPSTDCQPEYLAEEICKSLISLYQKLSMENKKHELSQGM